MKYRVRGAKVKSVEELCEWADKHMSVIWNVRRIPAKVLLQMQADMVVNIIRKGLYLYIPQGRSPRKSFGSWAKLCGMEVIECKEHSL